MSDWKARATPVPALPVAPEGGADWKARAQSVEATEAPSGRTSTGGALLRGFGQGLTFNFGDELGAGEQALLAKVAQKWPGLGDALGLETRYADELDAGDVYRDARSENREQLALDEREHGKAAFAGNLAGGLVLAPLSPGGAAANATRAAQYGRAALTGAGFGALGGVGASQADLTEGEYGKAALHGLGGAVLGAGLGAAGKAVGDGLGAVVRKGAEWARTGLTRADELAEATGKRMVDAKLASLRGDAGSAATRAGNTAKNIDRIDLSEVEAPTAGFMRESLREQIAALSEDIAEAEAKAVSAGVEMGGDAVGRVGEFLSKGSKLDVAQKAASKLNAYRATVRSLEQQLKGLAGLADDAPLDDMFGSLMQRQAAVKTSPEYGLIKSNLLGNELDNLLPNANDALAKRAVFAEASATKAADEAAMKAKLLSGEAAKERMGQLAKRYLPPLVGTVGSTALGGVVGGVGGAATGLLLGGGASAAMGGLAGAGMRPAVQAILRSTAYPPVLNAASRALGAATGNFTQKATETVARPLLWKTAHALATRPEVFGPFAAGLAKAVQGGDEALAAEHARLSATSPDYQERMRRLAAEDEWN